MAHKTKQYKYEGTKFKFNRDQDYTMKEIAEGMGTSYQYVAACLQDKTKFLDEYFLRSNNEKSYTFDGNKCGLVKGQKYTLVELEEITGVWKNTICKRIKKGETFINNWHVRRSQSANQHTSMPRTPIVTLSNAWLRRKL